MADYCRSEIEDKLILKVPQEKDHHLNPSITILKKKQELAEINAALANEKKEYRNKSVDFERRQQELDRKETKLKSDLKKFDKFLRENDVKRARSLRTAAMERAAQIVKGEEIETAKQEIERMNEEKLKVESRVSSNQLYRQFLQAVVETSVDYNEINDILHRHDLLVGILHDLLGRCEAAQAAIDTFQASVSMFCEGKNNEILQYNNQLSERLSTLENIQTETSKLDTALIHIKNTSAKQTLLLGTLKMATHNTFQLLSEHKKLSLEPISCFNQLDIIESCMLDLIATTKQAKKMASESSVAMLSKKSWPGSFLESKDDTVYRLTK